MKKTITKQDGTTEVVEGTAEELAEYERRLKKENLREAPPKKKEILKGLEQSQSPLVKFIEEFMKDPSPYRFSDARHSYSCEISIASRGWWSVFPPKCTCGLTQKFAPRTSELICQGGGLSNGASF